MAQFSQETSTTGAFVRQPNRFTARPEPEPGRYRLVVSLACPWAHRAVIVRKLLGLEDAISLAVVDPIRDEKGWRFQGTDPVLGIDHLKEAYDKADGNYEGRVTVPALVDTTTGEVVTNDYPQITLDFSLKWRPESTLYPEHLRQEIDAWIEPIFHHVNNGVYKAGFATSQEAYEEAYTALFTGLDRIEEHLTDHTYLVGEQLTEADIRLWTTLVRFDAVYHGHFKCNRNKLTEMPNLWAYAKRLYAQFGDTVDWDHIKRHYYVTHHGINPTGIVPAGPDPEVWTR
ncbi:glutathione S-transferase C-terminal domain-containing protein [Lentzea sp. BCCO 10_0061]|uniref:Glutathione S-transferase C-terminal domain-containing protein n=1 Tax=Lentzea sokolovensis TaxID=3095429 RepID=A0ABU4V8H2_9PSEU|nr:glutathione S-transferase C-terminal domain-containing protein [Lentzea sp. BCCO 10_0061]MDX8148044.1 glutathione S-transferase C-terminal domain-containing protein [Lentzea sp. BCCO 10_0061]